MQPFYVLLLATSNPKSVGGMYYAIFGLTLIGLKQQLVTTQSQPREARHAIPPCIVYTSYPSMQLPNYRPGKLDILSQHVVTTNHGSEKSDTLSQHV